jgi:membrane associated rhomboid family serine protease
MGDDDNRLRIIPIVTYLLVALNIIVFLIELISDEAFIVQWAFVPTRFLANPTTDFPTLFTSMFMHGGLLHIGGNMLYLWIFGDNVEDNFGHPKFLIFYLLSGLTATATQLAVSLESNIPNLGASGAIAGTLGAYILLFPKQRVHVMAGRGIIPMPAIIVIGFWFILQLFSGIGSLYYTSDTGGIAYMAHIGGFIAGIALALIFKKKKIELNFKPKPLLT